MYVKLLIDEDVSPFAAKELREKHGVDAIHLRDRGKLGLADEEVLAFAFSEDRILVTANVGDFVKLARSAELHPGIVALLQGNLLRREQVTALVSVVAFLQNEVKDLANRLLYVDGDKYKLVELPPNEKD